MTQRPDSAVQLRPWSEGDLPLLHKLLGDPAMTEHISGPLSILLPEIRYLGSETTVSSS